MATKPNLDGYKARFIFSEIDDREAENVDAAVELLDSGLPPYEAKLVHRILRNSSIALRMTTLLRAGKAADAEAVAMGLHTERNK